MLDIIRSFTRFSELQFNSKMNLHMRYGERTQVAREEEATVALFLVRIVRSELVHVAAPASESLYQMAAS